MTDNKIKKALRCCADRYCKGCPEQGKGYCKERVAALAWVLIDRREAEIERLTINMNAFGLGMKREKERADTARAEAIKEFAERLKEKSGKMEMVCGGALVKRDYTIDEKTLNNLVKEMVCEG